MTRIRVVFWTLCVGLTGLWIAADPVIFGKLAFSQSKISYINYTGITAMGVMSVSMLLALRSIAVEPYVGGLDKSYRLHKWLGVAGLVMAIGHWLLIKGPGFLTSAGLMAPAPRGGAPKGPQPGIALFNALKNPARSVGEWCFYALVALVVLALLRWFPYRWFLKTHRILAIVYLVLVFHSIVLLKYSYWSHAISYVSAALMLAGSAAAIIVLFRRVGRTRQAVGELEDIKTHGDVGILQVNVCLKDRWSGHDAGQFAFVDFADGEGPHPFTIASTWKDDGRLSFLIKGLGDYTRQLPTSLTKGSLVTVEGPYGQFTFGGKQPRQIWVSAGIGITPFISRMQELASAPDRKIIDLFHATAARAVTPVGQLRAIAESAGVKLHLWVASEDGWLTGERIRSDVPEWRDADVWFCGPVEFGKTLRKDLLDAGLPAKAFHQELFHLR